MRESPGKKKSINTIQGKYTQDEQPRLLQRRIGQIYIALMPSHKRNTALGTFSGIIPTELNGAVFVSTTTKSVMPLIRAHQQIHLK